MIPQSTNWARPDRSSVRLAVVGFVNGALAIGVLATAAHVTQAPFVFPSLGPTAFLLFYVPKAARASPRNIIIGHGIGALAGLLCLTLFGLNDAAPALLTGVGW